MKKILITGFSNFSVHYENSSQIIAEAFKEIKIEGFTIHTSILPVTFSGSYETLKRECDNFKPDYILSMGLAANRSAICLEKVAINFIHSDVPDNEGIIHHDKPILEKGPSAYFSTLPIIKMLNKTTPFPVEISYSAGTYVCNYLMYRMLHDLNGSTTKAGFIHLPHLSGNKESLMQTIIIMMEQF